MMQPEFSMALTNASLSLPPRTRKAKPAGVLGAEIWVNVLPIGQPTPGDPDTFRFVALDPGHEYASRAGTQTPYTLDFDAADGGKNAHYLLRWVNSTGQKSQTRRGGGPWSETATVTVGA